MNRLAQEAVLVGLARRLQEHGSWSGETHLQKAAYLLSELRDVKFDFDFILYKHGPFSFELRDELEHMEWDGLIQSHWSSPKYGAQLLPTPRAEKLVGSFSKTMARYGDSLDWIASVLGGRGVKELERLATAMWMTRQNPEGSIATRAQAVVQVKPHISMSQAEQAVKEIDRLLDDSQ